MAVDSFTLEQAEAEIAEHRGQIDILGEYHGLSDSTDPPVAPGAGNGSALYSVNGVVQHMTDSGLTGPVPLTWPDTGTQTVTATSATSLSAVYTIPGGDANVGTVYRMTAWGNGTWGATQQTMAFGIGFPGVTEFGAHQAVLS